MVACLYCLTTDVSYPSAAGVDAPRTCRRDQRCVERSRRYDRSKRVVEGVGAADNFCGRIWDSLDTWLLPVILL